MSSRMVTHGRRTWGDGQRERVTQTATHAHCCRPQQQPPPCRSSSNNYRGYGNNLQLLLLLRLLQLQLRPLSTKKDLHWRRCDALATRRHTRRQRHPCGVVSVTHPPWFTTGTPTPPPPVSPCHQGVTCHRGVTEVSLVSPQHSFRYHHPASSVSRPATVPESSVTTSVHGCRHAVLARVGTSALHGRPASGADGQSALTTTDHQASTDRRWVSLTSAEVALTAAGRRHCAVPLVMPRDAESSAEVAGHPVRDGRRRQVVRTRWCSLDRGEVYTNRVAMLPARGGCRGQHQW